MKNSSLIDRIALVSMDSIDEPIIHEYFARLNDNDFTAVAELFSEEGYLKPPFESLIKGRKEITEYFVKEATNMVFYPETGGILSQSKGEITLQEIGHIEYQIQGKVQMSLFTVSVQWLMQLNRAKKIAVVEVKLLASLNELLKFNRN
jgi:Nuclear transport factor 2 (NTF2) domain